MCSWGPYDENAPPSSPQKIKKWFSVVLLFYHVSLLNSFPELIYGSGKTDICGWRPGCPIKFPKSHSICGLSISIGFHWIGLRENWNRKPPYFMVKFMVFGDVFPTKTNPLTSGQPSCCTGPWSPRHLLEDEGFICIWYGFMILTLLQACKKLENHNVYQHFLWPFSTANC